MSAPPFPRTLVLAVLLGFGGAAPAWGVDANTLNQMRSVNRYLAQGQLDPAARVLEQMLVQHPEDPVASVTYADVLLKLERYDDADAFLERALGRVETKTDLYRMREALRRVQGRPDEAFADIVRVLESAGQERSLWAYREAEELLHGGLSPDRAHRLAAEAETRHADDLEFVLLGGAVETLTGRGDEALRRMVARDRERKREGEDVLRLADAARSLGLEEAALGGFLAAADLAVKPPRRTDILQQVVEIQVRRGLYPAALASLERIAAERTGTAAAANALLESARIRQEHLSDPKGALAIYEKIQDDPMLGHHRPTMLAQMGDSYLRLGRMDEAAAKYRAVIPEAFDPEEAEHAAYVLGDIEFFRGHPDSALVLYQDMAEAHPRSRYADQAAARYILLNKLAQTPGGSDAATIWGRMEWARMVGDSAAVATAATRLIEGSGERSEPPTGLDELAAEALLALADAAVTGKNYPEALTRFEAVVTEHPADRRAPEALRRAGDLLNRVLGKPDEALARYESILTDYPGSVQAGDARRMVEALRRELKS